MAHETAWTLGGMSWESSVEYERHINRIVPDRLGAVASADLLIRSFNFADIEAYQEAGDRQGAAEVLAAAAQDLVTAGAQAIVICTNTMHRVADEVEAASGVLADPHRGRHRGCGTPRRGRHCRTARNPLHDGAGLLRRPTAQPWTAGVDPR